MLTRKWIALAALLIGCLAAKAVADPLVRTLDNGARLVVEENHATPVVAVRFYVNTGSVFEGQWLGSGISHYVEHCADRGAATRTAAQIQLETEELGNDANAYTSKRLTCYHIATAAEFAPRAIRLLGDYVLGATFPPEEVEIQRGIILREIARGEDEPSRLIYDLFEETMLQSHPNAIVSSAMSRNSLR